LNAAPEHLRHRFLVKKGRRIINAIMGVSERFTSTVLWSPEHRLMVGWSPKAGCTMVKRHLIEFMGITDAAAETGKWVQTYSYHYHQKYIVLPAWE